VIQQPAFPVNKELRSDPLRPVPAAILRDLHRRYGEPHRAYHTWKHIDELLGLFVQIGNGLRDPMAVLFALLFHDAIYDPRRSDNEERSADLLDQCAPQVLPRQCLSRAKCLIAMSKSHVLPSDVPSYEQHDASHFIDMDLAILGASAPRYDEYERQIRAEYRHVPDHSFRVKRAKLLTGYLERQPLFLSSWGQDRFADRASRNLRRALAALG
jgi:predicted metal-dependent HD superfamily phosphohydrolase